MNVIRFTFLSLCLLVTIHAEDSSFSAAHPLRNDPAPALRGDMIRLSDYGTDDVAYLTLPPTAPFGGVVVIHEWWGLNDYIKATSDKCAGEGFVVVAVDLYSGQIATDPGRAADLMNGLNHPLVLKTVQAAVNFLHQSPRFHCDRVAVLGWCMGGGLSLESALTVKGVDAAVMYYGPVQNDEKKVKKLEVPLLGIFGLQDKWVTPEDVHTFDDLLTRFKKPHEFHFFDAVHAFANPSNANYREDFANQAWRFSIDFLKTQLSAPPPKKSMIDKLFN